jgi:hypothetical protein
VHFIPLRIVSILCLALLLVSLPLISSCGVTGYAASSTAPHFRTFMDMIRYTNEVEGGVDGIKINVVWADDGFDPAKATRQ